MLAALRRQLNGIDKLRCRNADQSLVTPFVALYVRGTYSDRLKKCCQNSKLPSVSLKVAAFADTQTPSCVLLINDKCTKSVA
jgi:hypothetical protein